MAVYVPQTPLVWLSARKGAVAPQPTPVLVFSLSTKRIGLSER
ncbi:hypothetical protein [Nostoc sp.]